MHIARISTDRFLVASWLPLTGDPQARRALDLLPVPYFHVVFTLPAEITSIAFQNKKVVYAILFRTAAETLRLIAADRLCCANAG